MTLIRRASWGARYADGSGDRALPATEAWLHHTVTIAPDLLPPFDDDDAAIRLLELIGQQRFGQGMSYTRLFTPVGRVYEGHSVHRIGAHTGGHNTKGIGYSLVGNYDEDEPSEAMLEAVAQQIVADHRAGYLAVPRLNGGHRDTKSTGCPGRYAYAAIPIINARAAAIMAGDDTKAPGLPGQEEDEMANFMLQVRKGQPSEGQLYFCGPGFAVPVSDGGDDKELRSTDKLPVHTLSKPMVDGVVSQIRAGQR